MTIPTGYYDPAATGANDGSSFANAFTGFVNAVAQITAGGKLYVKNTASTEVLLSGQATVTSNGTTPATRINILCVDGSLNPSSGAVISSAAGVSPLLLGCAYVEGVAIPSGTGATSSNLTVGGNVATDWVFGLNTQLALGNTSGAPAIYLGNQGNGTNQKVTFRGGGVGKFKFNSAGQCVVLGNPVVLRNMIAVDTTAGGVSPSLLFLVGAARPMLLDAEAVDFSGATSSLFSVSGSIGTVSPLVAAFRDCLLASTTLISGSFIPVASRISFARCSTGAGANENRLITYEGWQADDTTTTLQGGATDNTTLRSWRVSTANSGSLCGTGIVFGANWASPFESQPIFVWNDQVGSALTVSLNGIWGAAAVPNNDDIWLEIEAEGNSGSPLGTVASGTKASFAAANAALPAGTGTWNNPPSPSSTFTLQATITPQQKGWLKLVIKVAKAATDFRVDPKPTVSGGPTITRSYTTPSGAMVHETTSTVTVTQVVPIVRRIRR